VAAKSSTVVTQMHNCEQMKASQITTPREVLLYRNGWAGGMGGEMYNSTVYLATRTLAKLQSMGRLAHDCSIKPVKVCSMAKRQDN